MKRSIPFIVMIACGGLAFSQNPGGFSAAGKMTVPRDGYTATLLASGKVLIRFQSSLVSRRELYRFYSGRRGHLPKSQRRFGAG
jgi:hypothetical protein